MSANDRQEGGDHYQNGGVQHWDFTWEHDYDQFEYAITKYVSRFHLKNGMEDLMKAKHYLDKYMELGGSKLVCDRTVDDVAEWTALLSNEEIPELKHVYQAIVIMGVHIGNLTQARVSLDHLIDLETI
jgi:hypothetical protein